LPVCWHSFIVFESMSVLNLPRSAVVEKPKC
jgi:hypothetical protein